VLVAVTPFVRYMIGQDSPFDFPRNFGTLFAVSVIGAAIGWTVFSQVREPKSRSGSRRLSIRQHLARGWRIVHTDKSYRRLIRVRLLVGLAAAVRPFFIVFATQVWGMADEVAATFLAIQVGAELIGAGLVGQISDRFGNRNAVLVAVSAMLLATVAAVAAAFGAWDTSIALGPWSVNLRIIVLGFAFIGSGVFMVSLWIGYINYIMDIAPESQRPSYIGFSAGFTMPLALAPLAFGWAADALGYRVVFVAALVLALAGLYFALNLPEPRDHLDDGELEQYRVPPTAQDDEEAAGE
jgi:Na+/melibiose symporter-like transporter